MKDYTCCTLGLKNMSCSLSVSSPQVPISGKDFQGMQGLVLLAKDNVERNG